MGVFKSRTKKTYPICCTRIINIYGHTEGALVGHPVNFQILHFMPQNGFIELLGNKEKLIKLLLKEILLQQDLIIRLCL